MLCSEQRNLNWILLRSRYPWLIPNLCFVLQNVTWNRCIHQASFLLVSDKKNRPNSWTEWSWINNEQSSGALQSGRSHNEQSFQTRSTILLLLTKTAKLPWIFRGISLLYFCVLGIFFQTRKIALNDWTIIWRETHLSLKHQTFMRRQKFDFSSHEISVRPKIDSLSYKFTLYSRFAVTTFSLSITPWLSHNATNKAC